jgi:hypothetical protein
MTDIAWFSVGPADPENRLTSSAPVDHTGEKLFACFSATSSLRVRCGSLSSNWPSRGHRFVHIPRGSGGKVLRARFTCTTAQSRALSGTCDNEHNGVGRYRPSLCVGTARLPSRVATPQVDVPIIPPGMSTIPSPGLESRGNSNPADGLGP